MFSRCNRWIYFVQGVPALSANTSVSHLPEIWYSRSNNGVKCFVRGVAGRVRIVECLFCLGDMSCSPCTGVLVSYVLLAGVTLYTEDPTMSCDSPDHGE